MRLDSPNSFGFFNANSRDLFAGSAAWVMTYGLSGRQHARFLTPVSMRPPCLKSTRGDPYLALVFCRHRMDQAEFTAAWKRVA